MNDRHRRGERWNRRAVVQWGALIAALHQHVVPSAEAADGAAAGASVPAGYGRDPPLNPPQPSRWPRLLGGREKEVARWLLDELLPADDGLPAASEVGLVDFLDEWLSAPYPEHARDRAALLPLLNACARALEQGAPAAARWLQEVGGPAAPSKDAAPSAAFERLRVLAAAAYYTTTPGMAAIGYVGNLPRERFDGPPAAVLQRFDAALRALAG